MNSKTAQLTAAVLRSESKSYEKYLDITDEKRLIVLAEIYRVDDIRAWARSQIEDLERRAINTGERSV